MDTEANQDACEDNSRTDDPGCSNDARGKNGNLGMRRIKTGLDSNSIAARDLGLQRGRRASNKQYGIATSTEFGRRAFNILLSPNNVKTNNKEKVNEWECWFREFITEASGWSDHLKVSIVKNPRRMADAVTKMKVVNSVEDTPA